MKHIAVKSSSNGHSDWLYEPAFDIYDVVLPSPVSTLSLVDPWIEYYIWEHEIETHRDEFKVYGARPNEERALLFIPVCSNPWEYIEDFWF